jgi:hypothetical protein
MKQLHVVHGYDTLAWDTSTAEEIGHSIAVEDLVTCRPISPKSRLR